MPRFRRQITPKGAPTEHEEQRELVSWFRRTYPGVLIFAIPNGGARSRTTAARLKVEGVVAGVPDLYIPAWRTWVEMKTETGRVSDVQREVIEYLRSIGDRVIIGYGLDDAVAQLERADER